MIVKKEFINRAVHLFSYSLLLIVMTSMSLNIQAATVPSAPSFSKIFLPGTIGPESVSMLRFDIGNTTGAPVTGLEFVDFLPSPIRFANPTNPTTTCGGTITLLSGESDQISFSDGGLGVGQNCFITVNVTSSTIGTHTNTSGNLFWDTGETGTATADLTVSNDRPGFTKSFKPDSITLGSRSTLSFVISNERREGSICGLDFSDQLPPGMVIADPANQTVTNCESPVGSSTFTAAPGGNSLRFNANGSCPSFPNIPSGEICVITVDVLGNAVGALGNVSSELLSGSSFNTSSGKAGNVLNVTGGTLILTKSFTDDPAPPGSTTTLNFTIRNFSRDFSATGITFTDDLDATLSGLVASTPLPTNPCGAGSALSGTSLLTLSGGNIGPGGSCSFNVTLQIPAGAAQGSYPNTTSQVSGSVGGSPVTGNQGSDTLFVSVAPLLTKTFTDDPAAPGGTTTLEFTITNTSSVSATDIGFTDVFDPIIPTASAVPATNSCGAGSTFTFVPLGNNPAQLTVSGAELASGGSCTFSIVLDIAPGAPGGTYSNTTSNITATVDGDVVTGKSAKDDLVVVPAVAIRKEFTDDPAQPGGTTTLVFTLTLDEFAPGNATNISFSDNLNAVLAGLTATGPVSNTCGGMAGGFPTSSFSYSGGTLTPGASCEISITLDIPAGATSGSYANTTSNVLAMVSGLATSGSPASDNLLIAGMEFTKSFTNDPVIPGGSVTLEFTINNLTTSETATNIAFNDDLATTLSGLTATGLPLNDICGTGSSLTGSASDTFLTFAGGTLAPGASCTFNVTLNVPAGTDPNIYNNRTSPLAAHMNATPKVFAPAIDQLSVAGDLLQLSKSFTNDPVEPGQNVTLAFTLSNLDGSQAASDIGFTDDLNAVLAGLAATALPTAGMACNGGTLSGTDFLTFSGGTLAAGASCTFSATLAVPAMAANGIYTNTTSQVVGTVGGLSVTGIPATDDLNLDKLLFSKSFSALPGPVPGGTVELTFNIQNPSSSESVSTLGFTDNLEAVLSGLVATGLPDNDICGSGSSLSGTSSLSFTGGNLLPGGSCTFTVTLQIPAGATIGNYLNSTSELLTNGLRAAGPAIATLTLHPTVTFTDISPADGKAKKGSTNVLMGGVLAELDGTENLNISSLTINAFGTGDDSQDVTLVKLWKDDGDGEFNPATDTLLKTGTYPADDGSITFDLSGSPEVLIPGVQQRYFLTYDFNTTLVAVWMLPIMAGSTLLLLPLLGFTGFRQTQGQKLAQTILLSTVLAIALTSCSNSGGGGKGSSDSNSSTFQVAATGASGATTPSGITPNVTGLPVTGRTITVKK